MAWGSPKTNWQGADVPSADDFNRIEGNTLELYNIISSERTAWNAKLDSSAYTAADVLAKIKTMDGAGSGLDADTWQGYGFALPGNTVLWEQLSEGSKSTGSFITVSPLIVVHRPGFYRFTGEVRVNNPDSLCNIYLSPGYGMDYDHAITTIYETESTSYVSFSLDTIKPLPILGSFFVTMRPYGTVYYRNLRIRYMPATRADVAAYISNNNHVII
jgi:hypothetical protein